MSAPQAAANAVRHLTQMCVEPVRGIVHYRSASLGKPDSMAIPIRRRARLMPASRSTAPRGPFGRIKRRSAQHEWPRGIDTPKLVGVFGRTVSQHANCGCVFGSRCEMRAIVRVSKNAEASCDDIADGFDVAIARG
jgi:hypothetical protein